MKKIAVFFSRPEPMDYPFSKPDYWASYAELSQLFEKKGGKLYFVRSQRSYKGNGKFSNSWMIENGSLKETGQIVVNGIFDKGRFQSDGTVPVFNPPAISEICTDKWKMYQLFSEFCPSTLFVETPSQLPEKIRQLSTDLIVFKPFTGAEGVGVKIESAEYFSHPPTELQFPAIVQEYLDTSGGVPGLMEGHHDLRLALFDGEILYSYLRTPPTGSLLANVARGGTFMMLEPSTLPQEVVDISTQVDQRLAHTGHRFYSVDFGYTPDGPKIIEMNSELGLLPNRDHPVFATLKEKLVEVFLEL